MPHDETKSMAHRRIIAAVAVSTLATGLIPLLSSAPAEAATSSVSITSTLNPADLHVAPGTTVTWTNNDSNRHEVRSTSGPSSFRSDLQPGQAYSYTFSSLGTYQYIDARNQNNSSYFGDVVVENNPQTPAGSGGSTSGGSTSGGSTSGGSTTPPSSGSVTIVNKSFSPRYLTVAANGTVTWTNQDSTHTVTSDSGLFDSGSIPNGGTYSHVFAPGTYPYHCDIHPSMTGTITVPDSSGSAPPPAPAPAPAPAAGGSTGGSTAGGTTAAGSTGGAGTASPAAPSTHGVTVADYSFTPASIGVTVGDTVSWTNSGKAAHTITADDGSFNAGKVASGGTFNYTFSKVGTFAYHCEFHPEMVGSVTVGEAGAPAPAPAPVAGGSAGDSAGATRSAGSAATAQGGPGAVNSSVDVIDYGYTPDKLSVPAGTQVTWHFVGKAMHTVTGDSFDSGFLTTGAEFRHTFAKEGTFTYHCNVHPDMTGTVTVTKPAPGAVVVPAGTDGASGGGAGGATVSSGGEKASGVAATAAGKALRSTLAGARSAMTHKIDAKYLFLVIGFALLVLWRPLLSFVAFARNNPFERIAERITS